MLESPFPFTPVPSASTRHDGWTPDKQRAFIAALGQMGTVSHAARAVGMTPRSAHRLRGRTGAEAFAAAWDRAINEGLSRQFEQAIGLAINGREDPVFYRGRQVGTRRRYNDRIMLAALRVAVARNASSHSLRDVP